MTQPSALSSLFHASLPELHVPSVPYPLPSLNASQADRAAWIDGLLHHSSKRRCAYYDEKLQFYLSLKIPKPSTVPADGDYVKGGKLPVEVLAFIDHIQVTLESSYISASPPSPYFPPTPNPPAASGSSAASSSLNAPALPPRSSSAAPQAPPLNSPSLQVPNPFDRSSSAPPVTPVTASGAFPPLTPNPTPTIGYADDKKYVRAEGVPVFNIVWGEEKDGSKKKDKKEIVVGWVEESATASGTATGSFVAVWELEVPVAFIKTRIQDPLLCLTGSVTLRGKHSKQGSQDRSPSWAGIQEEDEDEDEEEDSSQANGEFIEGMIEEQVNLIGGLAGQHLSFPSTRIESALAPTIPVSPYITTPTLMARKPSFPLTISPQTYLPLPTLRKSYRSILSLSSGLSLRMRTVFLPQLVLDPETDVALGGEEDGTEDDRRVVMSVEVEAPSGEVAEGFDVEDINIVVGGSAGAKAQLIGFGSEASASPYPLELQPSDQFNLLFSVSFEIGGVEVTAVPPLPPPTPLAVLNPNAPGAGPIGAMRPAMSRPSSIHSNMNIVGGGGGSSPDSFRPVSISVTGRLFIPDPEDPSKKIYPTRSFVSRWNCSLDVSTFRNTGDKRLSLPMLVNNSGSGVPGGASYNLVSRNTNQIKPQPQRTIAGDKRFTLQSQQQQHFTRSNSPAPSGWPTPPSSVTNGTIPPTPAYPSYGINGQPPVLPSQQPLTGNQGNMSRPMDANRLLQQQNDRASSISSSSNFNNHSRVRNRSGDFLMEEEVEGILVSVSICDPPYSKADRKRIIKPLLPFTLEIFVFNRSENVRRFTVGVPEKRRRRIHDNGYRTKSEKTPDWDGSLSELELRRRFQEYLAHDASIIPLENNVRVGPLAPGTCQSVRMRFLALREGVHNVETLSLVGVDFNFAVNLKNVCHVIVEPSSATSNLTA